MSVILKDFVKNLNWKKMAVLGGFILIPFALIIVTVLLIFGIISADDIAKIVGAVK